jgi:glutamate racemase
VGEKVRVIDPAPAVAKQVKRLLEAGGMKTQSSVRGEVKLYTSGDVTSLKSLLPLLLGENGLIERVEWVDDSQIK